MFTGIIKSIGTITNIQRNDDLIEVTIENNLNSEKLNKGESVNVDGICSTIVAHETNQLKFQYMPETIKKTSISSWKKGTKVNLEPSLSVKDAISGHFVMGHIDTTGKIRTITKSGNTKELKIGYPKEFRKFIALKGSISVNGISLTVSVLKENTFTIALIPHTLENTTLETKKEGDVINIEIDILSRYLKQLFDARDEQTSYEFLKDRGFI